MKLFLLLLIAANFIEVKISPTDTIYSIANKYLRNPADIYTVLRLNNIYTLSDFKPGIILKIPYTLSKYRVATVVYAVGDCKLVTTKATSISLGTIVTEGATLKTGKNSKLLLELDSSNKIFLTPNTTILLTAYRYKNGKRYTLVTLVQGEIRVVVNSPIRFMVSVVNVSMYKGYLTIRVDNQKNAMVAVKKGTAEVMMGVKKVPITAGYLVTITKEGIIQSPVPYTATHKIDWMD